jgi:hypothetical protein
MNFKNFVSKVCMRVDLNKENTVVYILSKSLPKCSTYISQVILFKLFPEILPKYSTDTSPNIFSSREVPLQLFS